MGDGSKQADRNADWEKRWEEQRIGFNQETVNPRLKNFFSRLTQTKPTHCLVPLCGKSIDMLWIVEQGGTITGVELSPLAIDQFFSEQNDQPTRHTISDKLTSYETDRFHLIQGDFFDLQPNQMKPVDWIYDRAALIALPPTTHTRYAHHLARFLNPGGEIFLLTIEYDPAEMEGPPFPAPPTTIDHTFSSQFQIKELDRREIIHKNQRFRDKGLSSMIEGTYLLRKRG